MKPCDSVNVNCLRIVVRSDLQDLSISYLVSIKHPDIKSQHPYIEYPNGYSSPSREIPWKLRFICYWKIVYLNDNYQDDHDWKCNPNPNAHNYWLGLSFCSIDSFVDNLRLVATSSPFVLLLLLFVYFNLIVEHFVKFLNSGTLYGEFIKITHGWIFSQHIPSRWVVGTVVTEFELFFLFRRLFSDRSVVALDCLWGIGRKGIWFVNQMFKFWGINIISRMSRWMNFIVTGRGSHQGIKR